MRTDSVLKVETPICMHIQPVSIPYFVVMLGAKAPVQIQEVTLMHPIHGNL